MSNLFSIYEKCNIYQKHAIARGVFKDNLAYGEGSFRTPFIDQTFEDNLQIVNKKGLLFYKQSSLKSDVFPIRTQRRNRTGTVSYRCLRPTRLPVPPAGHLFLWIANVAQKRVFYNKNLKIILGERKHYFGRSSFNFLSTTKGINGSKEAKKINTAFPNFHFCSCQAITNSVA